MSSEYNEKGYRGKESASPEKKASHVPTAVSRAQLDNK
jgi:hypothetical protein